MVSISALAHGARIKTKSLVLGSTTVTIAAGHSKKVKVSLNAKGRRPVASHHRLRLSLEVTRKVGSKTRTVASKPVTFKAARRR